MEDELKIGTIIRLLNTNTMMYIKPGTLARITAWGFDNPSKTFYAKVFYGAIRREIFLLKSGLENGTFDIVI